MSWFLLCYSLFYSAETMYSMRKKKKDNKQLFEWNIKQRQCPVRTDAAPFMRHWLLACWDILKRIKLVSSCGTFLGDTYIFHATVRGQTKYQWFYCCRCGALYVVMHMWFNMHFDLWYRTLAVLCTMYTINKQSSYLLSFNALKFLIEFLLWNRWTKT